MTPVKQITTASCVLLVLVSAFIPAVGANAPKLAAESRQTSDEEAAAIAQIDVEQVELQMVQPDFLKEAIAAFEHQHFDLADDLCQKAILVHVSGPKMVASVELYGAVKLKMINREYDEVDVTNAQSIRYCQKQIRTHLANWSEMVGSIRQLALQDSRLGTEDHSGIVGCQHNLECHRKEFEQNLLKLYQCFADYHINRANNFYNGGKGYWWYSNDNEIEIGKGLTEILHAIQVIDQLDMPYRIKLTKLQDKFASELSAHEKKKCLEEARLIIGSETQ